MLTNEWVEYGKRARLPSLLLHRERNMRTKMTVLFDLWGHTLQITRTTLLSPSPSPLPLLLFTISVYLTHSLRCCYEIFSRSLYFIPPCFFFIYYLVQAQNFDDYNAKRDVSINFQSYFINFYKHHAITCANFRYKMNNLMPKLLLYSPIIFDAEWCVTQEYNGTEATEIPIYWLFP